MGKLSVSILLTASLMIFPSREAKAQSSTNCISLGGGMVHCDTTDMRQPSQDGGAALGRGIADLITRGRNRSFRRQIGGMIANGDCEGARRFALERGELEMADQVAQMCEQSGHAGRGPGEQQWMQYGRATNGAVYSYDRNGLVRHPDNLNVRISVDMRNVADSPYPFAEMMLMVRCERRDYALMFGAALDEGHKVVEQHIADQLQFASIEPESVEEHLWNAVCR